MELNDLKIAVNDIQRTIDASRALLSVQGAEDDDLLAALNENAPPGVLGCDANRPRQKEPAAFNHNNVR
jgi:hypothetical protein